jgi:hypothetical protein
MSFQAWSEAKIVPACRISIMHDPIRKPMTAFRDRALEPGRRAIRHSANGWATTAAFRPQLQG